jgi:hypothetical protein
MNDEHDEGTQPVEPQDQEPQAQESPDDDAGPAVEPLDTTPSQGEQVPQDPSAGPHPTSAPPAEAQSGVPPLPENEGVEPGDGEDGEE